MDETAPINVGPELEVTEKSREEPKPPPAAEETQETTKSKRALKKERKRAEWLASKGERRKQVGNSIGFWLEKKA